MAAHGSTVGLGWPWARQAQVSLSDNVAARRAASRPFSWFPTPHRSSSSSSPGSLAPPKWPPHHLHPRSPGSGWRARNSIGATSSHLESWGKSIPNPSDRLWGAGPGQLPAPPWGGLWASGGQRPTGASPSQTDAMVMGPTETASLLLRFLQASQLWAPEERGWRSRKTTREARGTIRVTPTSQKCPSQPSPGLIYANKNIRPVPCCPVHGNQPQQQDGGGGAGKRSPAVLWGWGSGPWGLVRAMAALGAALDSEDTGLGPVAALQGSQHGDSWPCLGLRVTGQHGGTVL